MRGQASVEYVAAVTLLACVLAGAGVAVAAPDLPGAVVRELRLALCIVGGDVCRASDARERDLEPCLLTSEDHQRDTGVSFLFFRAGGTEFWTLQRRSDGRLLLTAGYGQDLDATARLGAKVGPFTAGGHASGGVGFRSGRTWVIEEDKLRALLAETDGDPTNARLIMGAVLGPPAEEFLEGGGTGAARLAAEVVREVPGAVGEVRGVLGRRETPAGTAYYFDLGAGSAGPLADAIPGVDLHGRVVAEYLDADPPVLTLRAGGRQGAGDEVETLVRLPLRTPEDVAAARRVAFVALANPTLALADLVSRAHARGSVQRLRYRTRSEQSGWSYGLELGLKLGADRSTSVVTRELVDAEVLNGRFPARREDCLQFAAAR